MVHFETGAHSFIHSQLESFTLESGYEATSRSWFPVEQEDQDGAMQAEERLVPNKEDCVYTSCYW